VVVRVAEFMVRMSEADADRAFSPFNVVVRVTEFMVTKSEADARRMRIGAFKWCDILHGGNGKKSVHTPERNAIGHTHA
jgi:hypothetical protein